MKKLVAMISVVACLLGNISVGAFNINETTIADNQTEVIQAINKTLQYIEPQKEYYGLPSVDFTSLQIGAQIHAYEYIGTTYAPVDFILYPLFSVGQMVALAIVNEDESGKKYAQIDTQLISLLNAKSLSNESFAIIYDRDSCYYAAQDRLVKLKQADNTTLNRSTLTENKYFSAGKANIAFPKTTSTSALKYSAPISAYTASSSNQIFLSVGFQLQPAGSSYCWACSVAVIGNYLTSYNYTGIEVAQHKYPGNYNQGASINVALSELNALYHVSYFNTANVLTSTIKNNLSIGYPLFAQCTVSGSSKGHAVVVCGFAEVAGLATIMDPDNHTGYVSAYNHTGTFTYTSLVSGNQVYLSSLGAYTA